MLLCRVGFFSYVPEFMLNVLLNRCRIFGWWVHVQVLDHVEPNATLASNTYYVGSEDQFHACQRWARLLPLHVGRDVAIFVGWLLQTMAALKPEMGRRTWSRRHGCVSIIQRISQFSCRELNPDPEWDPDQQHPLLWTRVLNTIEDMSQNHITNNNTQDHPVLHLMARP